MTHRDASAGGWARAGAWALAASLPRLAFALIAAPINDEWNWGDLVATLLRPGAPWPLRGFHHPVLPVYLLGLGRLLFGTGLAGSRVVPILAGAAAVGLVWQAVREMAGPRPADWAAFLLTWNEFHLAISGRATDISCSFFFLALGYYFVARFLRGGRDRTLLAAGACFGLAAFCREDAVLSFALVLAALTASRRIGFRLAAGTVGIFLLACLPDIAWNAARLVYGPDPEIADYRDHLARVGGLGWSWGPLAFFLHPLAERLAGPALPLPGFGEYPGMSGLAGALLLSTAASSGLKGWKSVASAWFWGLVAFFSLIAPAPARLRELDQVLWLWCAPALLPGVAIAGAALSRDGPAARAGRIAALLAACWCVFRLSVARFDVPDYSFRQELSRSGPEALMRLESFGCPVCAPLTAAIVRRAYTLPDRRELIPTPEFKEVADAAFESVIRPPSGARAVFLSLELDNGSSRFVKNRIFRFPPIPVR